MIVKFRFSFKQMNSGKKKSYLAIKIWYFIKYIIYMLFKIYSIINYIRRRKFFYIFINALIFPIII